MSVGAREFSLKCAGRISYFAAASLEAVEDLRHYFISRKGGVSSGKFGELNMSVSDGDDEASVKRNWSILREDLGLPGVPVRLRQVHGDRVLVVDKGNLAQALSVPPAGDAVVTGIRNVPLAVLTADCAPVVICDPEARVLGVAHAGWRGTASAVVWKTVLTMIESCGASPERMVAAIGPAIAGTCYEVGEDVREAFLRGLSFAPDVLSAAGSGKWTVDLKGANLRLLLDGRIPVNGISVSSSCTHCEPEWFYSARRDRQGTGRHSTVAYLA